MSSKPSEAGRELHGYRGEPHRVRLPGFIKDEDVGLGEVIKRATSIVGIRPCGGCTERARRLSSWMVFSK
jgi:hypothetical protein